MAANRKRKAVVLRKAHLDSKQQGDSTDINSISYFPRCGKAKEKRERTAFSLRENSTGSVKGPVEKLLANERVWGYNKK